MFNSRHKHIYKVTSTEFCSLNIVKSKSSLCDVMDHRNVHFDFSLNDLSLYSWLHLFQESKTPAVISQSIWMKCSLLFVEARTDSFCTINILGRQLNLGNFIKHTFNTDLDLDAHEPISCKLGMIVYKTKVYILMKFE